MVAGSWPHPRTPTGRSSANRLHRPDPGVLSSPYAACLRVRFKPRRQAPEIERIDRSAEHLPPQSTRTSPPAPPFPPQAPQLQPPWLRRLGRDQALREPAHGGGQRGWVEQEAMVVSTIARRLLRLAHGGPTSSKCLAPAHEQPTNSQLRHIRRVSGGTWARASTGASSSSTTEGPRDAHGGWPPSTASSGAGRPRQTAEARHGIPAGAVVA